jgi:AcrR family transcriptional regulator
MRRNDYPVTARGRQTRQKLLDAAEEIFGSKGYENTSVAEITQRAGVAQGTFYIYFPDKKAAFTELVKELNHLVRKELAIATRDIDRRIDAERAGLKAFFKFVLRRPDLYRIIRQAEFVDYEIFRWHYRQFSNGYVRQLRKAMKGGQVKQLDAETTAYCLMAIAEFMGMRWVLWQKKAPPEKALATIMDLISAGISGR